MRSDVTFLEHTNFWDLARRVRRSDDSPLLHVDARDVNLLDNYMAYVAHNVLDAPAVHGSQTDAPGDQRVHADDAAPASQSAESSTDDPSALNPPAAVNDPTVLAPTATAETPPILEAL